MTRILLHVGAYGRMRAWRGTEGGYERVIFMTGGYLRFYLSIKAFGFRIRLFGRKPFAAFLRS